MRLVVFSEMKIDAADNLNGNRLDVGGIIFIKELQGAVAVVKGFIIPCKIEIRTSDISKCFCK
jgi:hypothetical protein